MSYREGAPTVPQVSVLLSTYNRAGALPAAIDSVLAQQGVELELLVVDDCSTDGTAETLKSWSDDGRVRLLRNAENLGLPASLNRAVRAASAPLLARIDDDDRWQDRFKLQRQLDWMAKHPDTVLLGTAYVDEWGRVSHNPISDEAIRRQMLLRCPFCHSSVVLRTAAVLDAGAYDESLPYAEDWDLWLRLGRVGKLANLEEVTLLKEQGENTLSERFFLRQLAMASDFATRYGKDYPGAFKARTMHAFNRFFFRVFPAGGRVHKAMGSAYRRVFRINGAPPPPASS